MAGCEFDRLFASSVPHIYEKIFFSLDYTSFKECMKVCRSWNDLLTSQSFRRIGKSTFCYAIHEELSIAIEEGLTQVVKRILLNGMVDIEYNNNRYCTPLYLAARYRHSVIVQLLIDAGADPNNISKRLKGLALGAPLAIATVYGHLNVVKMLLNGGAQPNIESNYGVTCLHLAAMKGHNDVLNLLLEKGANPNAVEKIDGYTPMHFASRKGNKDGVRCLLNSGANPNITDREGLTPLNWAMQKGHMDVANLLTNM